MMLLTDEKDIAKWEQLSAFNADKRETTSVHNHEPSDTITGEYETWKLVITSDEKGALSRVLLDRGGVEKYTFSRTAEIPDAITATAHNANQFLGAMLQNAATLTAIPEVTWHP